MDGAEAGVASGPELATQPIAAEAGYPAHHCVCEDPDTPRRPCQARKDPGRCHPSRHYCRNIVHFLRPFCHDAEHPAAGKAPKGRSLHMCEGSEQWHYYC